MHFDVNCISTLGLLQCRLPYFERLHTIYIQSFLRCFQMLSKSLNRLPRLTETFRFLCPFSLILLHDGLTDT